MAGQLWGVDEQGGFLYSDQLSKYLRLEVQPMMRFRQFCSTKDAIEYGNGDAYQWDIITDIDKEGGELEETQAMPQGGVKIRRGRLTITEYGMSVPYTKKLDNLSKAPVRDIIKNALKNNCAKTLDKAAYNQFAQTRLVAYPTGGNSATSVTIEAVADPGANPAAVNDAAMSTDHVKGVVDSMKERNIPGYDADDYYCIGRPRTFRNLRNELEQIKAYVESGWREIRLGEIGLYEGTRFIEQTNIASKSWTNSVSDEAFFLGGDTVAEAVVDPEHIRGKLPTDYGRNRGVAWYYMGGFGIVHNQPADIDPQASQNRIIRWASAN